MRAEDGRSAEAEQVAEVERAPEPGPESTAPPESGPVPERSSEADDDIEPEADDESDSDLDPDLASDSDADADDDAESDSDSDSDAEVDPAVRRTLPIATGIGCAALILPLVAVAGAILCFAAGILSAAGGCAPNGSALCSANGPWFAFALPLFVSPLIAAGTAIGAVTVRRHRSTWLAVGYGVVFISIIVGLASASTGSN